MTQPRTPQDPKVAVAVGEVPAHPDYIYLDLRTEGALDEAHVFLDAEGAESLGKELIAQARRMRGEAAATPTPGQPISLALIEGEVDYGFNSTYIVGGLPQAMQITQIPNGGYVIHQYYGWERQKQAKEGA